MLLSSQSNLNYDDRTSSNPPRSLPAGDGNSGRGDRFRNIFSDALDFVGGRSSSSNSHGPGKNDSEGQNDNEKRNDNSRLPDTRGRNERPNLDTKKINYHLSREDLRDFAISTLRILDDGEYFPPGAVESYDLKMKIKWTDENTRYFGPDAGEGGEILESEFIKIKEADDGEEEEEEKDQDDKISAGKQREKKIDDNSNPEVQNQVTVPFDSQNSSTPDTPIYIGEYSTLVGARKVHFGLASNFDLSVSKKIGVLNFASAKKPGGGFINGSQAQEESIARSSTLYPSLITHAASQFYMHYQDDPNNAYYTHAMVYSPSIVLIRDDSGEWRSPVEVDILTSAAVNAGEIRRGLEREEWLRREREEMEIWKRKGEERRREREKAMAEREKLREEKTKMNREIAKLKKEKAELTKLQKGMVKNEDKGKAKDPGSEKEETFVEQEKVDTEVQKEKEKERGKEEDQEEKTTSSPEIGSSSDGDMTQKTKENTESKGVSIQDDQPRPEASLKVNQESRTQPSQAPSSDPDLTYALALSNAETEIQHTMYARISRILHLFQLHQIPHLILGSFGTGVFQNHIDLIAAIFADLLIKPSGRFKNVFKTIVFAILGKETVRVFAEVFSRVDKQAQRESGGTGGLCVFFDRDGSDGDNVREGSEERKIRVMKWEARRTALANTAQEEADADCFAAAQVDAAAYAASFAAAQADAAAYVANRIPEDGEMILTKEDETVNLVPEASANATSTPKALIIDDGTDVEMVEIKSLSSTRYREAQNSKSNEKDDGDIEMQ